VAQKRTAFHTKRLRNLNNKKQQRSRVNKKSVSKRIESILGALSATARGDFSHYCKIENLEKPDSLDALSIGINIMISDLSAYAKNLEETIIKLNEKTEELQKFNKLFIGRELKMTELKNEIEVLKKELAKEKE
jgi:methyl-accepting chemotaxis protein